MTAAARAEIEATSQYLAGRERTGEGRVRRGEACTVKSQRIGDAGYECRRQVQPAGLDRPGDIGCAVGEGEVLDIEQRIGALDWARSDMRHLDSGDAKVGDYILRENIGEMCRVGSDAAVEGIVARTAGQVIVAGSGEENIIAACPVDDVAVAAALNRVAGSAAVHRIASVIGREVKSIASGIQEES